MDLVSLTILYAIPGCRQHTGEHLGEIEVILGVFVWEIGPRTQGGWRGNSGGMS